MKQKIPQQETNPSNKKIVALINKKWGDNTIGTVSSMKRLEIDRISTGVSVVDEILGGGFALGRMVELYGVPSSGKTLISLLTIKQAQEKGLECVYVDAENAFSPEFAQKLGVNIDKLNLTQVSIGEDVIDIVFELLKSKPGIIVVDSIPAMIPRAEFEEQSDQQFMANKARLMSRSLPKLTVTLGKTLIIWINQLRSTMAMYGPKNFTPGGRALGFFSSIRCEIKQGEKIFKDDKKTGEVIGNVIQVNCVKNKTAPPYRQTSFNFYYENARIE